MKLAIEQAVNPLQLDVIRALFLDYQAAIGVDLCFQNFSQELANLPDAYAPPKGRLLLGSVEAEAVGCIALRPLEHTACEMKRLFVKPQYRSHGFGRLLIARIIEEAQEVGYRTMFLDTLDSMTEALSLYRDFGFRETAPYCFNPIGNTKYLVLDLGVTGSS